MAALTHDVQPERLAYIAANVPRISIITGDDDALVAPTGSERIYRFMTANGDAKDRVEFVKCEKTGHAIHVQQAKVLNALIEKTMKEGSELIDEGWKGKDIGV